MIVTEQSRDGYELLPRQTDVLVVGGGVVGLCVAHYLSEIGREVTVIDQGAMGGGSSHGNAGLIAPSHSVPFPAVSAIRDGLKWMVDPTSPFYVRPSFDRERFAWLVKFGRASTRKRSEAGIAVLSELLLRSADLFDDDLSRRDDMEFAYRADGVLNVHESERSMEDGIAEARLLERYGVISQSLDSAQLAEAEPALGPGPAGGILWPQDRHLDPSLFVRQLADSLERRGVLVRWSTELLSLSRGRGRVGELRTTCGEIEAGEVVLATGAWSPSLSRQFGLRLPVQAAKGYSVTSAAPESVPRRPLLFADARVVATPLPGRLRLAGTLELVGLDMNISRRRIETIRNVGSHFLSDVEADSRAEVWRGLRPLSADGLPVIGRPQGLDNVIIATGHGHLGVSLAPITGQLVSELVSGGGPSIDMSPLSPDRF